MGGPHSGADSFYRSVPILCLYGALGVLSSLDGYMM